jgi:hypothetical protein
MSSKKLHKVLGITLTLPILGWALTGIVFLTKPGYEGAYERLVVKTYPLEQTISFTPEGHWHQALSQRTILGNHLLLSNGKEQVHLHPATLEPYLKPSKKDIRALIEDAITLEVVPCTRRDHSNFLVIIRGYAIYTHLVCRNGGSFYTCDDSAAIGNGASN